MARTRVVIDTDPGVDDAVAILLAVASPELDVVGITTVNGNVAVDLTTTNARRLLELARASHVPIAAGAAVPLGGPVEHAAQVHGNDGLGDLSWEEPSISIDSRDAVDLISDLADEGPLTLIAIGPLTNLAELVRRRPETVAKLERVVIMGGASFMGNVTAVAEFNVWADPEAAAVVAAQEWPVTWLPLDVTHQVWLDDHDIDVFGSWGTELGDRLAGMLRPYANFYESVTGVRHTIMHDALAIYEVIAPGAISSDVAGVNVECGGDFARGLTIFDRRGVDRQSNHRVGASVDRAQFTALLHERLARLNDFLRD